MYTIYHATPYDTRCTMVTLPDSMETPPEVESSDPGDPCPGLERGNNNIIILCGYYVDIMRT